MRQRQENRTMSGTMPGKTPDSGDKKKSGIVKQWWGRYIRRLNKATGGKPQCCK